MKITEVRYFSDLQRCLPEQALSWEPQRFRWRMIPYQAESFSGTFLMAGEETQAPEVCYPLEIDGWYDIYIGVFSTCLRPYVETRLRLKLEDDPVFHLLHIPAPAISDQQRLHEVFWRSAELKGQKLSFRQVWREIVSEAQTYGNVCDIVWIAYIKLVPLSRDRVELIARERRSGEHRRLFATNDAWSFHNQALGVVSEESIRRHLEPYRHTDFSRIYWEAARGDLCNYPTRLGRTWTGDHMRIADFPRIGDRLLGGRWKAFFEKGIDPLQVAVEHCHEVGLEFHASYRLGSGGMGAFYYSPPFDAWNRDGFYEKHPEFRCVRRDGTTAPRISYAFPETRAFVLSLLEEVARQYEIDGISIFFHRRPPLLEYEGPLVKQFQQEFGTDPRQLVSTGVKGDQFRRFESTHPAPSARRR